MTHQICSHAKAPLSLVLANLSALGEIPHVDAAIESRAGEILPIFRECYGPDFARFVAVCILPSMH